MKRNQNAIEEMQRLGKDVCDCQKQLKEAEHALEKYVREYMTEITMNCRDITESSPIIRRRDSRSFCIRA